jgi:hypothetical protein
VQVKKNCFVYLDVVDDELLEAVRADVASAGGRAITDLWHQKHTLETAADSVINTLWLSPVRLEEKKNETLFSKVCSELW